VSSRSGALPEMGLGRIVLTFRGDGEVVIHTLYRSEELGPSPGTKVRTRHVVEMTRRGLQDALEALQEGSPECVGSSGFTQREDVLLATTSPSARQSHKLVKGA
jgi:hypothetical protein